MAGTIRQHCRAVLRCLRWTQRSAVCVAVSNSSFPELASNPNFSRCFMHWALRCVKQEVRIGPGPGSSGAEQRVEIRNRMDRGLLFLLAHWCGNGLHSSVAFCFSCIIIWSC